MKIPKLRSRRALKLDYLEFGAQPHYLNYVTLNKKDDFS
jgi:hypothetical protein